MCRWLWKLLYKQTTMLTWLNCSLTLYKWDSKVLLDVSASNSDDALFDDVIGLVMPSSQQSVMMSSHCVHLSCLQCPLAIFKPYSLINFLLILSIYHNTSLLFTILFTIVHILYNDYVIIINHNVVIIQHIIWIKRFSPSSSPCDEHPLLYSRWDNLSVISILLHEYINAKSYFMTAKNNDKKFNR